MISDTDDTIAAIASPPGGGLRGVIRVSGPGSIACLARCFRADEGLVLAEVAEPRRVSGHMLLPSPLGSLPGDLYLWPDTRSYTRQPSAEWHTLGSPPLLETALDTILAAGARPARPGEFTLRAFLAGRLDLTQAEAVLGVIDAQDRRELDSALEQLAGGLTTPLTEIREQLLDLLAHLEAGLDFVEEDLEFIEVDELLRQLERAGQRIEALLEQMADRDEVRREPRIVLRGWPNVGKSSLLNALAGQTAALVADLPGTTRDFLGCHVELNGIRCLLIDTAGVEPEAEGELARAAQAMASLQHQRAHLELFCLDASRPLNAWERAELRRPGVVERLTVLTKIDRAPGGLEPGGPELGQPELGRRALAAQEPAAGASVGGELAEVLQGDWVRTSSVRGEGIEELKRAIAERLMSATGGASVVADTAIRCRASLGRARDELRRAERAARGGRGEELVAAQLRLGLEHLGEVVGAVYTEDVLDRVFSRFCIGK